MGSPINSVAILGAGALGSLYGAWMARAGLDVTLVAREAHVKAIQDNGLQVLSSGRSVSVPIRA
ncbi:MAG: hypothetical protein OSB36_09880, partial [Longimicrobiales bacterium]|nr:hypothetical protein [Longimicrobiales bacterium]